MSYNMSNKDDLLIQIWLKLTLMTVN